MNETKKAVDIIIPIYNGLEDLQLCIPSVKKHTDLNIHRLILINDCSPDERIAPYLDSLAEGERILVVHNEHNLGFSGNVNKGMQMSEDRDVILLNSDTIVTAGWVDKIAAAAYREPAIGTVTPLSNCATLCSVPEMCVDNLIPEGFSVDTYAELVERCSLHRYPRITVAVGFCMFIKRCVIEDVGLFDAETFGRGYGEENDFCNRAEIVGYHHIMCDDTFIYHKGTGSFDTQEKIRLVQEHDRILRERYPELMKKNDEYCAQNPDQEIRDNLKLHMLIANKKKNLLYVLHKDFKDPSNGSVGGTQLHVLELTQELKEEYNIFVAARREDRLWLTIYSDRGEASICFEIGPAGANVSWHDPKQQEIFEHILSTFRIDLVHVHHVQGLGFAVFDAAKEQNIPVVMTMHDYYSICPNLQLLDAENQFCADEDWRSEVQQIRCEKCLQEKLQITQKYDFLKNWRSEFEAVLQYCQNLIFPSDSAKDIFLQYYPQLVEKCLVITHGEDRLIEPVVHRQPKGSVIKSGRLKGKPDPLNPDEPRLNNIKGYAYLAGVDNSETEIYLELTDHKGNKDWFRATKLPRPDIVNAYHDPQALMCGYNLRIISSRLEDGVLKCRIFVKHVDQIYTDGRAYRCDYRKKHGIKDGLNVAFLGGMVEAKGSGYAAKMIPAQTEQINWFVFGEIGDNRIRHLSQKNYFHCGKYRREELSHLLLGHGIDVVCILPIWPETFCYTLSEAWLYGIPVICTDIGAVGARVQETGAGWVMDANATPEEILQKLLEIKNNPKDLQRKKQAVSSMLMKSTTKMCFEYKDFYEDVFEKTAANLSIDRKADYDYIFQGLALADPSVNGKGKIAQQNRLRNENQRLKNYLNEMKNTIAYRMMDTVASAGRPVRETFRRMKKR